MGASIALELDGKLYCPLHDHRGNIIGLVDATTGKIAESYRYTAFGECETYNHKQQQIPKSALNNSWGFASKRLDAETGFVYFSRRYYAPTTGRWITPDPLGFADGPNMYAYVHSNPMTHFDLYGLTDEEDDEIGRHSIYCLGGMLYQTGVIARNMVHYSAEFVRDPIGQMQSIGLELNAAVGRGCDYVKSFEFEHVREFMANCPQRMVTKNGLSSEQHSFDNGRATANAGVFALGILGAMKGGKGGAVPQNGNNALPFLKSKSATGAQRPTSSLTNSRPDFIVGESGVTIPTSRSVLEGGFQKAGFPSSPTIKPGTKYELPGITVRVMEPSGKAPLRASFEHPGGGHVCPFTGKPAHPPKGSGLTAEEKTEFRRSRTHLELQP